MTKCFFEYVWLDGYATKNLRSKVKVLSVTDDEIENGPSVEKLPIWNYDGSSTKQAPGNDSECLLKPVRLYRWRYNHYFVLCEVQKSDGTPHDSNTRSRFNSVVPEENSFWFGFEQEYFITKDFQPLGFPSGGYPRPQGLYYCGVGGNQVVGREFVEDHLSQCLAMGIELTGINAEVAVGQWEYQCFSKDALKACDDLWMSRYVLYRMAEERGWDIDIHPKPVKGDWNGSGCHTNFSNEKMRSAGDKQYYYKIFSALETKHVDHIAQYGEHNAQRLTGFHETQSIDTFSWGVADRGASIRVPTDTAKDGWKGYLEDRRPASNCDPYLVGLNIIKTVESVT